MGCLMRVAFFISSCKVRIEICLLSEVNACCVIYRKSVVPTPGAAGKRIEYFCKKDLLGEHFDKK